MPGESRNPSGLPVPATHPSWQNEERPTIGLTGPVGLADRASTPVDVPEDVPEDAAPRKQVANPGPREPRSIGKYRLLEKIGLGGMGVVYKAHDPDLRRDVALKMIRSGTFAHPSDVQRFLKESQTLAQLRHPNIIAIYDAGEHDGQPYFVMEYLQGGSVFLNRRRFMDSPQSAVALVEKIARATAFLHHNHMLHRDLKPGNILLDEQGEPYLSDFGLVKWLDVGDELTRSHQRLGTPGYMAPEQTGLVDLPLGPWTDVWALGIILYELLTGKRPFEGKSQAVIRQICEADTPSPSTANTELDRGLESIVLKCLQKDPRQRFGSAQELADELGRWLRQEPLSTRPPSPVKRLRSWGGRHPRKLAAAVLGLMLAIVIPALWIGLDPDRPLRQLTDELRDGRPVALIGASGAPKWSRWLSEKGAATLDAEGRFTLTSPAANGLLELVPEVPLESYRLRGKIRHYACAPLGQVGVFVCCTSTPTRHGKAWFFHELTFDDVTSVDDRLNKRLAMPPAKLPGNPAVFNVSALADVGGPRQWTSGYSGTRVGRFQPTRPVGGRWREVAVEVTPEHVQMFFEDQSGAPRLWKDLDAILAQGVRETFEKDEQKFSFLAAVPPMNRRGSLGIFVAHGAASFCEFVLEPLSPKVRSRP